LKSKLKLLKILLPNSATSSSSATSTANIFELRPGTPDFVKPIIEKLAWLLYWLCWVIATIMGVYRVINIKWARGDPEKGKKMIGEAIIVALILAVLPVIIRWLLGD